MMKLTHIFAFIFVFGAISSMNEENAINFKLSLNCSNELMRISIKPTQEFHGFIYTKGNFKNKEKKCFVDAEKHPKNKTYELEIPVHDCKTKKSGKLFSNTVIVQHDRDFITSKDVAFKLICDLQKKHTLNLKTKLKNGT
ncbi:uncharacterized protein LOC112905824 [Agrilus planipennis]|uniref:Uncharacterized protein LOC112905824 n=1 Tax=Agrilus planipennis TaxID=224129 RepID=A0A7F5RFM4_AGRPL|nr:uncharacterized protein LOC112905824 [Agrilus planipennis]